jgi:hypothetical protein
MKSRFCLLIVAAAALGAALVGTTTSGTAETPIPGERVRVSIADDGHHTIVGNIVAVDQEGVSIQGETSKSGGARLVRLAWRDVSRLDRSSGESRATGAGVAIGVLLGGFAGGALGASAASQGCSLSCQSDGGPAIGGVLGAIVGAVGGGVLGGVLGGRVPTERWERVDAPRLAIGVTPMRRGAAATLALRF